MAMVIMSEPEHLSVTRSPLSEEAAAPVSTTGTGNDDDQPTTLQSSPMLAPHGETAATGSETEEAKTASEDPTMSDGIGRTKTHADTVDTIMADAALPTSPPSHSLPCSSSLSFLQESSLPTPTSPLQSRLLTAATLPPRSVANDLISTISHSVVQETDHGHTISTAHSTTASDLAVAATVDLPSIPSSPVLPSSVVTANIPSISSSPPSPVLSPSSTLTTIPDTCTVTSANSPSTPSSVLLPSSTTTLFSHPILRLVSPSIASLLTTDAVLTAPSTGSNSPSGLMLGEETITFFDDMVNAPEQESSSSAMPTSSDPLEANPIASLPQVYRGFFYSNPELLDSDQSSSDMDMETTEMMDMDMDMMDMEMDEDMPAIQARALAEIRQASTNRVQVVPLIADRQRKLETIDTINLMNISQQQQQQNGGGAHANGSSSGANSSTANSVQQSPGDSPLNSANGNSNEQGSGTSDPNQHTPQRRKKASRACFHCQKAHLTCDDSRPCQRCVKRDLASTCADGVRKKAKYLQDSYDAQQLAVEQAGQQPNGSSGSGNSGGNGNNGDSGNSSTNGSIDLSSMDQQLLSDQNQQQQRQGPLADPNALFNFPMSADYGFGSEAVNLEYSILSTMLSSPTTELGPMSDLSIVENWQRQGSLDAMASLANNNQLQKALAAQNAVAAAVAAAAAATAATGAGAGAGAGTAATTGGPQAAVAAVAAAAGAGPLVNGAANSSHLNNGTSAGAAGHLGGAASTNPGSTAGFPQAGTTRVSKRKFPSNTPENVYANTKQPFNYTDGFHYLLRYVRERMDKEEMMRICRAMAMFRPSFIALIMNLTPEDLIFMEKCFQRTILEFEKLISFSGTPTVVWRRTGEIALVGKEFSLLTQWGRDQLVGKKTYIYELMDNQSAVEYWEKFSTHAFENTEQTVMTTCILLSPTNRVVPCTFCFTIKRDIFDIPLAIVGNFLPILS